MTIFLYRGPSRPGLQKRQRTVNLVSPRPHAAPDIDHLPGPPRVEQFPGHDLRVVADTDVDEAVAGLEQAVGVIVEWPLPPSGAAHRASRVA